MGRLASTAELPFHVPGAFLRECTVLRGGAVRKAAQFPPFLILSHSKLPSALSDKLDFRESQAPCTGAGGAEPQRQRWQHGLAFPAAFTWLLSFLDIQLLFGYESQIIESKKKSFLYNLNVKI